MIVVDEFLQASLPERLMYLIKNGNLIHSCEKYEKMLRLYEVDDSYYELCMLMASKKILAIEPINKKVALAFYQVKIKDAFVSKI